MIIDDRVYGNIIIPDGVLTDLVNSRPMQRLKQIGQTSAVTFLHPERNITRFEHSIGVWFLLQKFGASLEEQIAGLLHDTPHTAFSHVADIVFPNENHNFHEQFEEEILTKSDIPEILQKHGLTLDKLLNKENYRLLESELPDLSADRIDYFLRDTRIDPIFPDFLVRKFLDGFAVHNQIILFQEAGLACLYTLLFMNAGKLLWLDPDSHGSYYLLAEALKRAIQLEKIKIEDFFKTDSEVMDLLSGIDDMQIKSQLQRLTPHTRFGYCAPEEADFSGPNKPRIVDPFVISEGQLKRVSDIIPALKPVMEEFRVQNKCLSVKMMI